MVDEHKLLLLRLLQLVTDLLDALPPTTVLERVTARLNVLEFGIEVNLFERTRLLFNLNTVFSGVESDWRVVLSHKTHVD